MKPSQQRASHPDTVDPHWLAGKVLFAKLTGGMETARLTLDELKDALRYSRTLLFPPAGGGKVKVALRKEAVKRGVLL